MRDGTAYVFVSGIDFNQLGPKACTVGNWSWSSNADIVTAETTLFLHMCIDPG